jgi:hypothetical protein
VPCKNGGQGCQREDLVVGRLNVRLYDGWTPQENGAGPVTYMKGSSCLQFSHAYNKGDSLSVDEQKLISICERLTRSMRGRRDLLSGTGTCQAGSYGTVMARADEPAYMQAWVIKSGNDMVLVTHICEQEPSQDEVKEATAIALMTTLSE